MQNNAFQCNRPKRVAKAQSKRACASRLGRFWQKAGEESLNTNCGRIKDSKKMQGLLSIISQCTLAKWREQQRNGWNATLHCKRHTAHHKPNSYKLYTWHYTLQNRLQRLRSSFDGHSARPNPRNRGVREWGWCSDTQTEVGSSCHLCQSFAIFFNAVTLWQSLLALTDTFWYVSPHQLKRWGQGTDSLLPNFVYMSFWPALYSDHLFGRKNI